MKPLIIFIFALMIIGCNSTTGSEKATQTPKDSIVPTIGAINGVNMPPDSAINKYSYSGQGNAEDGNIDTFSVDGCKFRVVHFPEDSANDDGIDGVLEKQAS